MIPEEFKTNKVLSVIKVVQLFLHTFEGKKPIKPELKFYGYYQQSPWSINVTYLTVDGKNQTGKISVSQFETLGAIRQKIATFFKLDQNEFNMKVSNMFVNAEVDDDKYVKEFGMSQTIYLFANNNYVKTEHPKFLIEKDKDLFELIFYLLTKQANLPSLVEPVWALLQELPVNK